MRTLVMEAALEAALPGETPLARLMAAAQKLGCQYDGCRWHVPRQSRRWLRRLADRLGIDPPEPLEEDSSLEFDEQVLRQEQDRQVGAIERAEERFRRAADTWGAQAVFDGQGAALAKLVEADLPLDSEALAWVGGLMDFDPLPIEGHVRTSTVRAVELGVRSRVRTVIRARHKHAALTMGALEPSRPFAGVVVSENVVRSTLQGITPEVNRRAAVKRALKELWRARGRREAFPKECPPDRWDRIAWLTFVGYALPPVVPDRRLSARRELADELAGTGLTPEQMSVTLGTARKEVPPPQTGSTVAPRVAS